ncbi:MAG: sulfurtransferase, partial [Pseudomonadota bacterium]|nr:sulfurtransferase [Pseudomonadota bacterium]
MILNVAAYLFVAIDDADALSSRLHDQAKTAGLLGSVLVAPEGINLFLSGDEKRLRGFLGWLRDDARFTGITIKESWSVALQFARLKVKRKDEIIAFRRANASPLHRE